MSRDHAARGANYWRDAFLRYFEGHGCVRLASDRLVSDDPTTLFTVAGMQQFKEDFTGVLHHGTSRATTSQKCMRTPDLENVGRTQRHHTFFEMLGYFSFGDFFKREAIPWIWEFYTSPEWCGLSEDRLRVSVFQDDDEAYDLWRQFRPHLHERGWIYRMGERDNFWPAGCPTEGPNGVCGPCSEIFFDGGERHGEGDPTNNDARFMEIGNIVFMQFERSGPAPGEGVLTPLPQKNIDFGGGLERLVMAVEGVDTTADTSLFMPIRLKLRELLGASAAPTGEDGVRERRIADHIRASVFLIGEGISPGNARQGYVLRRVIRRAYRDGARLGFEGPFLWKLAETIDQHYGDAYPEVRIHRAAIEQTLRREEEDFQQVLARGLDRLDESIAALGDGRALPGAVAFDLHSTYGLPIDVTRDVLRERGLELEQAGFDAAEKAFRELSRAGSGMGGSVFAQSWLSGLKSSARTEFLGYDETESRATIAGLARGDSPVESITGEAEATVLLDRTPFYAESGGQVGDRGWIVADGARFEVTDTQNRDGYVVHIGRLVSGELARGQEVRAEVDRARRDLIRKNHSATHLMHAALREVLGAHVHQKGSVVDEHRLRFDFSHPEKVRPEQIARVEQLVNRWVADNGPVETVVTTPDLAREAGALMFFGDTYGERVRMLTMGREELSVSRELCGGTHVSRTGDVGGFRIVSEGSVASGVRRIEAVTGPAALELAQQEHAIVANLAALLRVTPDAIADRVASLQQEVKRLKSAAPAAARAAPASSLADRAEDIAGVSALVHHEKGASMKELIALKDSLMQSKKLGIALLAGDADAKASLILAVSGRLVAAGLDAVSLMNDIAPAVEGRGGGNKELARAGGKGVGNIGRALEVGRRVLEAAVRGSTAT